MTKLRTTPARRRWSWILGHCLIDSGKLDLQGLCAVPLAPVAWARSIPAAASATMLALSVVTRVAIASPPASDRSVAVRVARIENGLLPACIVKDAPLPTASIADRMKHFRVPGLSVAFFDRGRIVWARGYGYADVATGRKVTPNTLFQAASISKPVTAMAAMRLVQERRLRLDDDVNATLKTWKVPENQFTRDQAVTLRRLLSHTAGLTGHGFAGYAAAESLPTLEQILDGSRPANSDAVRVDVIPGTTMRYSGGGYVVVRTLMSDVTGKPFPELMQQLVLGPVGMTHSTFQQPLPEHLQSAAATAYQSDGEPFPGRFHIYPEMAPDGLWTTASDLARFAIEVQNAYAGRSSKVLSQATAQAMLTLEKNGHNLAFFSGETGGKAYFDHDGSNFGYFCELFAFRDAGGQGVVVMTNGNNIRLKAEYLRAVAREYGWTAFTPEEHVLARVDRATLAGYAGTYKAPDIGKIQVVLRNDQLFLEASGMRIDSELMLPESEDRFFIPTDRQPFEFKKDETGAVTTLVIQYPGGAVEAKRAP